MREFPAPTPLQLRVRLAAGAVDVVAEERDTATVDVQPYDDRSASRELAEHTTVELRGDTLFVTTPAESGGLLRRSGSIRIDIRLPLDGTVEIKAASADTTCRGRYAHAALDTASGDIFVEQVTGDAAVRAASGDIRLIRVDGALSVSGASGDVRAERAGGRLDAKLGSGDLQIGEADSDVLVKTASGDVHIGAVNRGVVQVGTASGDVGVGVRAGTGVWLDLSTTSGSTSNGLDMGGDGPSAEPQLTLQLRTVSGDIDVHRVA
ncbi:MAG TPA: DUF4097 family beta strand repeat-containing protein [Micromonosporaceae bacterium]|nr:DUF4097 family beta strand repeat-containing protein [Micromonosporaceae bacterium]